jgi:uncharacterized integral membrane protein
MPVLAPQVLWLAGVLGAVYVASQQPDQPLPLLIAQQPWTVWFVGPAAAAVTGAPGRRCAAQQTVVKLFVLSVNMCLMC